MKFAYENSILLQTVLEMASFVFFLVLRQFYPFLLSSAFSRLQLMPLLQDLAGCVGALDTRLDELSRQSKLAREMVQSQAEYWEHQHCVSANPGLDNGEQSESRRQESGFPAERRLDLFPLLPFLRVRGNKGDAGDGCRERPLPELVREELLHRFVTGTLFADVGYTTS